MGERSCEFGPFAFDMQRKLLRKHGSLVAIGQKGTVLLATLLAAKGKAVSKSALMEAAWQSRNIEESNLAVQIAALRKCLGKSKSGEEWIVTVQRVGYQFIEHEDTDGALTLPDRSSNAHAIGGRLSILVSPFACLSEDGEKEYPCGDLSEDITAELTRWRFLCVQSHTAPPHEPDTKSGMKEDAVESDARYIVEGNVRRMDGFLRIAVRLVDVEAGSLIWAERFDCDADGGFASRDAVVRTIVGTLVGRLEAAAVQRANRRPPGSLTAYECVLRGNALPWDDPAGTAQASQLFARAIEIDPGNGQAHAMLAIVSLKIWERELDNSEARLDEAYRLAKRAVELEGNESACFAILGLLCMFKGSYDLALEHMRRALELNPNNQWNTADMGIVLTHAEQPEAALGYFERARAIDSYFAPPWYWPCVGKVHMVLRRYQEAITAFERSPFRTFQTAAFMAGCHAGLADEQQATALVDECLDLLPRFRIGAFMAKQPFKNPADAANIAECLHMAGLPQ